MIYLRESSALGDFLNSFHQGAKINGRDSGVTDKLDKVVNDHNCTALDLHAAVVQPAE